MSACMIVAFDDYVMGTNPTVYTSALLDLTLAEYETYSIQMIVDAVTDVSSVTLTIETSGDGRNWTAKNAIPEIQSTASIPLRTTSVLYGQDWGFFPACAMVRFRIDIGGTLVGTHIRVYVRMSNALLPPPALLPGCKLWLRSDRGVTIEPGSSPTTVKTWLDLSGAGNDASQTVTSKQPTISTDSRGMPRLTQSGNVYMTGSLSSITNHTLFCVVNYPSPLANHAAFAGTNSTFTVNTSMTQFCEAVNGIKGRVSSSGGANADATTVDTTTLGSVAIYSTMADGSNVDLFINGVSKATGAIGFTEGPADRYILMALGTTPDYPMGGDAYEYILFNRALTSRERRLVHEYLGRRYQIVV